MELFFGIASDARIGRTSWCFPLTKKSYKAGKQVYASHPSSPLAVTWFIMNMVPLVHATAESVLGKERRNVMFDQTA